jgi:hypothetical protein
VRVQHVMECRQLWLRLGLWGGVTEQILLCCWRGKLWQQKLGLELLRSNFPLLLVTCLQAAPKAHGNIVWQRMSVCGWWSASYYCWSPHQ